ncbi:MAG: outer membrane beta-barrel protein [Bacteroidia bacterium]
MVHAGGDSPLWQAGKRLALAARGEYYRDADGIMVSTALPQGTAIIGYSLNADVQLPAGILWRSELRGFQSDAGFSPTAVEPHPGT